LQISVDISNPIGVAPLSVFIKETTFGLVSACGQIDFEICGNEQITISGTIEKTYMQGSGLQSIIEAEYLAHVSSDSQNCQATINSVFM
jgi:hypothetical protein